MKKVFFNTIILACLFLVNQAVFAQSSDIFKQRPVFRINALTPSFGAEFRVKDNQSLYVRANANPLLLAPIFGVEKVGVKAEYRYFYNLAKRTAKEKNTADFAANYVSGFSSLSWNQPNIYTLRNGLNIGIQRNIGKWLYVAAAAGPKFTTEFTSGKITTKYSIFSLNTLELGVRF